MEDINKMLADAIKKEGLSVRKGTKIIGRVVSTKTKKTATLVVDEAKKVSKYDRYARVRRKIHVHVPEGIELKENDIVEARPTRKISKTKAFVVYRIIRRGEA